jgi:hypothetical protein
LGCNWRFPVVAHQSASNLDIVTLPANGKTWIQEADATLILVDVPKEVIGNTALWGPIMMGLQDFQQGVTQKSLGTYGWRSSSLNLN